MGLLHIAHGDVRRLVPLAPVCLVGRGPACLARIPHPACPAHWLELRWMGECWAWRTLNAEERTRGTGAFLPDGWRAMEVTSERGTRVALGGDAWIELVDAGPPEPFAWDVLADVPLEGVALEEVAEVRDDALLPLGAEGDMAQALADGQCWLHNDPAHGPRTLRAHVPQSFPRTLALRLDLARGRVTVELDLRANVATFAQGDVRVRVTGTCVRTLAVYARARGEARGGWLTAADAWAGWLDLGGGDDAPLDAVAWERARLRKLLHRARVGNVDALFASRKEGVFVRVRLGDAILEVLEVA